MNSLIMNTLKPTGVPVYFQDYPGTATTYVTFFEVNQKGSQFAEDEEVETQHTMQVDVWSTDSLSSLIKQVRVLMVAAGFRRITEHEFYESETKTFHKSFRFYYNNTTIGGI